MNGGFVSPARLRRLGAMAAAMLTVGGGYLGASIPAGHAGTTAAVGQACAYYTNISLFAGPYGSQGCAPQTSSFATPNSLSPSVTGPPTATKTDPSGAMAKYGPAVLFSSPYDAEDNLTNSGKLVTKVFAAASSISAEAKAIAVGPSPFWTKTPTSWQPSSNGTTGFVQAKCSASSPTAVTSKVVIKNGVVDTSIGSDGYPATQQLVPNNPPPGYRVDFTIDNIGDHGHIIFNEQIINEDDSLTVNAMHMYLEGPTALGDMIIGQVTCGHS